MTGSDGDTDQSTQPDGELDLSRVFSSLQRSRDPETRQRAVETLGNPSRSIHENKAQVVQTLIKTALTDESNTVRAEAINSLYFHGEEYIDRLVRTIADSTSETGGTEAARETFSQWLTADHAEFRMVGATGIRSFGDGKAVSEIKAALSDSDPRVQARAVGAYADLDPDSVDPIRPLLQTYNSHVRHAAVTALTRIGTPDALRTLASVRRSNDEALRRIAVEHLHKLDHGKSARILLTSLQDPSESVRRTAMISLIRLFAEGESVRPGEIRDLLVTDDSFDRSELLDLLSAIVDGNGSDHATGETRRYAVWLLGELTDSVDDHEAAELLLGPFQDSDTILADIAAAYFSRLETGIVDKELQLLLQKADLSPAVETRAELVLDKIRRNTASMIEARSIEYTYVRRPADYTKKHAQ